MTGAGDGAAAAALLLTLSTGCAVFEPRPPGRTNGTSANGTTATGATAADVRFAVRLRDGGSMDATVSYALPSGERREEKVRVPWESPVLSFAGGTVLSIHATTVPNTTGTLLCVLKAVPPDTGEWVGGRVARQVYPAPTGNAYVTCATEYRLGAWPPPEDDPETGNLLIRVG